VLHEMMESVPFPGTSWHEVLTTHPAFYHFQWALFFATVNGAIHCVATLIAQNAAPFFMGYSSTPPLPQKMMADKKYIELANQLQIRSERVNFHDVSSAKSKLSEAEVSRWLKICKKHNANNLGNERRFQECLFPIFTKGFTLCFGIMSLYDKQWLYDRSEFYKGWPYEQGLECCIPDIKFLYMFHVGWYCWKFFSQIFLDRHLKDYVASMIHHFCAMGLLALSYYSGTVRGGVVVLLLHDPADVVLQSAKLLRLMNQHFLMNIAFVILAVTWFTTRIVIFPLCPMLSAWIDFYEQHGNKNSSDDLVIMICCILMAALWILHIKWFWLIIEASMRAMSGKTVRDSRSDFEDNEDE